MAPLSPSRLRAINLIETLEEERRERGEDDKEAPEEAADWTEERIRAWFFERDDQKKEKGKAAKEKSSDGAGRASSSFSSSAPFPAPPPPPLPLPCSLPPPLPPRTNPALRSLWFPSAARLDPSPPPSLSQPSSSSCILVAFACAGSAEDLWSSEGSGPRRAPSPLLRWLSAHRGKMLAVQLPGRGARRREPFAESARAVAREVAALVAAEVLLVPERGDGKEGTTGKSKSKEGRCGGGTPPPLRHVPWFVAGHSLGAWLAFELASAARDAGLPPPTRLLLSAMPPPHTPEAQRPWRGPAALLPSAELVAECRAWGISEAVFSPGVWEEYEPLLRNDFRLFDEYKFERGADPPFSCPLTFFFGDEDARVPEGVARGWERYCEGGEGKVEDEEEGQEDAEERKSAADDAVVVVRRTRSFELVRVRGGRHLWPLDRQHKAWWLFEIASRMAGDLGLPGPEEERGG